jgi:hypothetical protein
VGTLLLLERVGLLHTNLMSHFWPIAMTGGGAAMLSSRGRGHPFAYLLIAFGVMIETQRAGWLKFRLWELWPLWLIGWGLLLLWRTRTGCAGRWTEAEDNRLSEMAIFGGVSLRSTARAFTGGNLMAMFGGVEVDFTAARLAERPVVLYADAVFGGVALRVPADWRVTMRGTPLFGGFEMKALPPAAGAGPEQHLVVKGLAMFGGVEVKN